MMKNGKSFLCLCCVSSLVIIGGCSSILSLKHNINMCDSVKQYLENADFEGKGQKVKKGDRIVVDYIGRLPDGTVFDTSIESVAKGCGLYNENRNYSEGLVFLVGAGNMISGFDRGVEDMKIGQTKTIEIPAKDAYGEWDENLDYEIEKSKLQNPGQYKEGLAFYSEAGIIRVYKVTDDKVYLTQNHELAGKNLIFDITIKDIE